MVRVRASWSRTTFTRRSVVDAGDRALDDRSGALELLVVLQADPEGIDPALHHAAGPQDDDVGHGDHGSGLP
jgi:hypothetical protein